MAEAESEKGEKRTPSLILPTIKTVAIVGIMSWLAAGWMSASTDREAMAQLAMRASRGVIDDPTTTGSIAARAAKTKIDPCTAPKR